MVFLLVIFILIILFITSKIRIEVEEFNFLSRMPKKQKTNYKLVAKVCILNKIPIIKINLTKEKIVKLKNKGVFKNIGIKEIERDLNPENLPKIIKENKVEIKKINFKLEFGTENASLTAILVPIISTLISFIIRLKIKEYKNQNFKVKPLFYNQNLVNIEFSGIFEIKMIHIINIIYILNKKKGEDKNERTSNRRSYAYSIDVNTIIGEPIETSNNIVIIPISKVSFGFAAGGSEFRGETINEYSKKEKEEEIQYRLPFGGGSGAGVTINPIAFLVIQPNNVKLMPVTHTSSLDKLLDYVPDLLEKTNNIMNRCIQNKKEQTKEILKDMQKKHDKNMKKMQDDKKEIERKIDENAKKINENKEENNKIEDYIDYEFEYDETLEDE